MQPRKTYEIIFRIYYVTNNLHIKSIFSFGKFFIITKFYGNLFSYFFPLPIRKGQASLRDALHIVYDDKRSHSDMAVVCLTIHIRDFPLHGRGNLVSSQELR